MTEGERGGVNFWSSNFEWSVSIDFGCVYFTVITTLTMAPIPIANAEMPTETQQTTNPSSEL